MTEPQNKDPAGTQYDSGSGHGWTKILPQAQQRCGHYDMCISVCEYGVCANEDPTYKDPNHCKYDTRKKPDAITLTPSLATHYQQRSQDTGKSVNALALADLTALMKKRTAREERRVWKEIEAERL